MITPKFIVLEGMDGAGKSSQVASLVEYLRQSGCRVTTCRDPGATPAGDAIRAILLDRHDLHLTATAEMLLYMAARAQLVTEVIEPALARGEWVVSDRYLLSNIVYQGHAGGLDPEAIRAVGQVATVGRLPDLAIVLDVDLATVAARLDRPLDKLESRGDGYRERLREGYRREAAAAPDTIHILDATRPPAEVAAAIRRTLAERFPELASFSR
jgi:dTMP kinase